MLVTAQTTSPEERLTSLAGDSTQTDGSLRTKYRAVRSVTRSIAARTSAEEQMVQSCPEASPMKWHQAHTTWFFETFVLRPFLADYKPLRQEYHWLFNSYYNSLGEPVPEKRLRAAFSRPSLDEVIDFRMHVDEEMEKLLAGELQEAATRRVILGLNHEQQHQELMLTDIKHALFSNPLQPAYDVIPLAGNLGVSPSEFSWHRFHEGLTEIGYPLDPTNCFDFCFDNETPRHKVHLQAFGIANRSVTCREYLEFMSGDAYAQPEFWLSEGWEAVKTLGWRAPLYWEPDAADSTGWRVFTLRGWHPLSALLDTPVCHVCFFEADAFARWRGSRLPTEAEWELAANGTPARGNLLDAGRLHPAIASGGGLEQLFGDTWEWTASPYTGYPGYKPLPGALGEYNGKFMSSQMILRGGSCVTPASHLRATYRNFFQPATRWQFTGIRLAA
jgi:ergothioneine biosynthesis protein EgtB